MWVKTILLVFFGVCLRGTMNGVGAIEKVLGGCCVSGCWLDVGWVLDGCWVGVGWVLCGCWMGVE